MDREIEQLRLKKAGLPSERAMFHDIHGAEKGEKLFNKFGGDRYRKYMSEDTRKKFDREQKVRDQRLHSFTDLK